MLTLSERCPHCGQNVHLKFRELHAFGDEAPHAKRAMALLHHVMSQGRVTPFTKNSGEVLADAIMNEPLNAVGLVFCPRCSAPAMVTMTIPRSLFVTHKERLNSSTKHGDTTELVDVPLTMLPAPRQAIRDPDWPDSIRDLFADTQDALNERKSPIIVVATCRTVLEACLKERQAKGKNNYERIIDLESRGVITKPIADWAHELRDFGNDAAHDAEATSENAEAFVDFLIQFLTVTYTLAARIDRRRAAVVVTVSDDQ